MKFELTAACGNCPFRREGFIPLRQARILEICGVVLGPQGGTFPCHKTTIDRDDEEEAYRPGEHDQHCAGALIFAEKHELPTQMMRIAERLGFYDMRKLVGQDDIFDSLDEMLDAHRGEA